MKSAEELSKSVERILRVLRSAGMTGEEAETVLRTCEARYWVERLKEKNDDDDG